MKTDIDKLISLTYEIEGLLLLLRDRSQESVAPHIRNLLSDKGRILAEMLNSNETPVMVNIPAEKDSTSKPETAITTTAATETITLPPVAKAEEVAAESASPMPIHPQPAKQPSVIEIKAEMPLPEAEKCIQDKTDAEEEKLPDAQICINEAEAEEAEADTESAETENARLKQLPEIKSSEEAGAKMLKLLTLNDRFRFRRELFGGSDTAMKAIMAVIATMHNIEDAKRYLTEEQGMDTDSEEVSYFLEIIGPFYN